jgi:hypothetical protein
MCDCVDVEIGSYANQVLLSAPSHMPKENGYCIDRCLAGEVQELWARGVTTTGCCCGHNKVAPFIGVAPDDIQTMKALGYRVRPNPMRPNDEDCFVPMSVLDG